DRHAGIIVGAEASGRGPFRGEADQDRVLPEQDLPLARQMLRIDVNRDIVAPGCVRERGGPGVDIVQKPLQQIDLLLPVHRGRLLALCRDSWLWTRRRRSLHAENGCNYAGTVGRPHPCTFKSTRNLRYGTVSDTLPYHH